MTAVNKVLCRAQAKLATRYVEFRSYRFLMYNSLFDVLCEKLYRRQGLRKGVIAVDEFLAPRIMHKQWCLFMA